MKKNTIALVFGILFGVSMLAVAYVSLIVGIFLAFAGINIAYFMYVFAALAVVTIVLSSFARKNIVVARVGLTASLIISAGSIIYILWQLFSAVSDSTEGSADMILFVAIFAACLALGIVATVFAYLGKKKDKNAGIGTVADSTEQSRTSEEDFITCKHCGASQSWSKERCSSCGAYLHK